MAWCRFGTKPLSEPMMVRLPTHICITWPQWVNSSWPDAIFLVSTCSYQRNTGICDAYMHHSGNESCFSQCIYATLGQDELTIIAVNGEKTQQWTLWETLSQGRLVQTVWQAIDNLIVMWNSNLKWFCVMEGTCILSYHVSSGLTKFIMHLSYDIIWG